MDTRSTNDDVEWLEGDIAVEPLEEDEIALADQTSFLSGLQQLKLPESTIGQARSLLEEVESATAALHDYERRHGDGRYFVTPPELRSLYEKQGSAKQRLIGWFKGRTVQIERTEEFFERVPVFVLAAPNVQGCSAAFTTSEQLTRNLDCKVAVYGSGLSAGSKWSCKARCEFSAESAEKKLVFVPAEITVGEVSVFEGTKKVGQGRQITVIEYKANCKPGVTLIPANGGPSSGAAVETYPLAGDTSGGLSTYAHEYTQATTGGFTLGLKAFGGDVSLTVDVTLERLVGLTYKLKGGYDYHLHNLTAGQGISWRCGRP